MDLFWVLCVIFSQSYVIRDVLVKVIWDELNFPFPSEAVWQGGRTPLGCAFNNVLPHQFSLTWRQKVYFSSLISHHYWIYLTFIKKPRASKSEKCMMNFMGIVRLLKFKNWWHECNECEPHYCRALRRTQL